MPDDAYFFTKLLIWPRVFSIFCQSSNAGRFPAFGLGESGGMMGTTVKPFSHSAIPYSFQ